NPGEADYKDALGNMKLSLGDGFYSRGDYQEAELAYREALAIAQELTRAFPDKRTPPYYSANVARNLHHLGSLARAAGRMAEAERFYREALGVQSKLSHDVPDNPGCQQELRICQLDLSTSLMETGQPTEALELLAKALALAEEAAQNFPHLSSYRIEA